jgi:Ca2+-dependent lipid-binding protein
VQHANGQRLRIELYDKDTYNEDDELGRVSLDLNDLRASGFVDAVRCRGGMLH